jgi:hypothetical protein
MYTPTQQSIVLEAEQSVLGGLMLDNDQWSNLSFLMREDFFKPAHQHLFCAIQSLAQQQKPFDPITLSEQLEQDQALDIIGGSAYLGQLASHIPSVANIIAYAKIVKEKSLKRQLATLHANQASSAQIKVIEDQLSFLANPTANLEILSESLAYQKVNNDRHYHQLARLANTPEERLNLTIPYTNFEEPIPLQSDLEIADQFPINSLGGVLKGAVEGILDQTQCPPEMAISAVLAAASIATQSLANVQIEPYLKFPTSNFFCVVGETGERKTGVFKLALFAHEQHEQKLIKKYKQELKEYKRQLKKNPEDDPPVPIHPNLLVSEPTYESIVKNLYLGQPTLGVFSDEGGRFLAGHAMSRENKIKTTTGLSEIWSGSPVSRSRSGEGTIKLYERRLSLLLMLQPHLVTKLFLGDETYQEQGFLGRFLVCYPQSIQGTRFWKPVETHSQPLEKYWEVMAQLLDSYQYNDEGELELKDIPLSDDAKTLWIQFYNEIEGRLNSHYPDIRGFANRAAEHAARLACVIQFCENPKSTCIDEINMQRGIDICRYFLKEALRLTGAKQSDGDLKKAQRLLDWIKDENNHKFFETTPDGHLAIKHAMIYQRGPQFVRSAGSAMKYMMILETHGYVQLLTKNRSKKWLIGSSANRSTASPSRPITRSSAKPAIVNKKQKYHSVTVDNKLANHTKLAKPSTAMETSPTPQDPPPMKKTAKVDKKQKYHSVTVDNRSAHHSKLANIPQDSPPMKKKKTAQAKNPEVNHSSLTAREALTAEKEVLREPLPDHLENSLEEGFYSFSSNDLLALADLTHYLELFKSQVITLIKRSKAFELEGDSIIRRLQQSALSTT